MATRRSEHLPRLSLATGFNLNLQQPAMFSPALPTAVQHNFHPGFPLANPLQTPVQSFFNAPVAPSRPTHRQNQASIQLAAAGIHPPNFMTPVTSHFPRPSIALALPSPPQPQAPPSHPFPGRSRRQLSIGGPPKAVLGGPARKTSPLPPGAPGPNPTPAAPEKKKKVIVNLPKETIEGEDGRPTTRPDWARPPLTEFNYVDVPVILAESSTADIYPPEEWRTQLPYTIDVYLPGKVAWETLKRKDIEDKLEKLGVERGSGSNVPHIHAPHARAASISSPADPALLLFKLNKLQQAQQDSTTNSAANSLSVSPQPPSLQPYGLTPSPHRMAPNRLGINHGHTLSLAQPLSYPSSLFSHSPSPFGGSNGVVDNEFGQPLSLNGMHSHMSLDYDPPPLSAVGAPAPKSQVDFMRGFGLDVPLESEEEDEEGREAHDVLDTDHSEDEEQKEEDGNRTQDMELDDDTLLERGPALEIDDATTTGPQSRLHSRHVSRVSAALSLSSVGGNFQAQFESAEKELGTKDVFENGEAQVDQIVEVGEGQNRDEPQEEEEEEVQRPIDPTEEWTGSEDACFGAEASEVESIGSFSNPSDEERARQDRSERRIRRRAARQRAIDQPRRLPEFPRPPGNTLMFPSGGREEDIISNPSEENLILARRAEFLGVSTESYYAESTSTSASVLGLHAAPHSRMASEEYSAHDPALAHSRQASGPQQHYHQHTRAFHHQHHRGFGFTSNETNINSDNGDNDSQHQHQSIPSKKNPLNPSAKPFVFGASGGNTGSGNRTSSGTWEPFQGEATPPMPLPTLSTHSRMPSFGKPLSASAPEFKPGQFNFRLPGAPQMPPAPPPPPPPPTLPPAPPLLGIPNDTSSPFRMQGREKRQRRDSNASMEEGGSLASFRFPPLKESSPKAVVGRRHRSGSLDMGLEIIDQAKTRLSSAEPFTFAGFSAVANNMPLVPKEGDSATTRLGEEDGPNVSSTTTTARPLAVGDVEVDEGQELLIPPVSASKPKRAPIPLDFKHPTNTVPAGLFKALASNGDERTRRGVRSRLNSREIFEHIHRPSMDDTNVPLIARKASRNRLGTDPGEIGSGRQHVDEDDDDDVFTSIRPHVRRRSSLPDALVERPSSPSPSDSSVAPQDLTSRMELHHVESVIAQLLDEKLTPLYDELTRREAKEEAGNTESMMAELIALFRAQLRDGAAKRLEDSQMDARGELDFQLIKEVVEESHQELLSSFQREVHRIAQQTDTSSGQLHPGAPEVISAIDGASKRTVSAVVEALSEFSARQDAAALNAPARERDLMVEKLVNVLSPMMDSLHTDPIDYEFLTRELAQAVKPHIAQLIDLASDKRETAGLIVDRILPLLPTLNNVSIDTDAITLKLTTEVRRAIAPIDAFEIKEQVADLVVERLDSRLAVRDKTFNVDTVTSRVTEGVSTLLETLNSVPAAVEQLSAAQKATSEKQETVADTQTQILASITDVPAKIESRLEQLTTVQENILDKLSQPTAPPDADPNIFLIRNAVESLEKGQAVLDQQNQEALAQAKSFSEKLDALPETFTTLTSSLQQALTELVTSNDSSKRELEEVRKLNTEYQFQLTKARSSHGQVRVEKDMLDEKLSHVQEDRDCLLAQVKDMESSASVKTMETSAIEARNAELEDALAKALARLQDADVAAQSNQSTIANLEKAHKEVVAERDSLKAKVAAVEAEVTFASREKDTVTGHLENLQRQHDQLVSQQSNWEALNAASEKINLVYKLLENADEEDQQELRQQRERSRALDVENAALQKRVKDAELKLSSAEKTATTALQTLSQAQQRSSEWERCAKDYEGQLEMVRTKLEQAEQSYLQLEADYNMAKVQIEEHGADNRLVQDRENKLREQIAALETKCSRLQDELEKANRAAKSSASPSPFRSHNGVPPRPDSRASTVYDVRDSAASNRRIVSSASVTSSLTYNQQPSVRDSIHAPSPNQNGQGKWSSGSTSIHTPPGRYPDYVPPTPKPRRSPYGQYNTRAPSPTPSVASTAPTRDADGWFI